MRNTMNKISEAYAYLWLRRGPVALSGQITGYRIPGPRPGEEFFLANFGAPLRNVWRVLVANGSRDSGWMGNYTSAEAALETHSV